MLDKEIQVLDDEILSYKLSIRTLEDKMNFINFLDSVDNSIKSTAGLDSNRVSNQKRQLERELKKLIDKRAKLIKEKETQIKSFYNVTCSNKNISTLGIFMKDPENKEDKDSQDIG